MIQTSIDGRIGKTPKAMQTKTGNDGQERESWTGLIQKGGE